MYLTPKRTGLRARSCAPANLICDATCLRLRRVIEIDTTLGVNVVDHWTERFSNRGTPSRPGTHLPFVQRKWALKGNIELSLSVCRKKGRRM